MTHSIKHLFHINATKEKVFEAINTINGLCNWWTVESTGDTTVGGTLQFDFGTIKGPAMQVIQADTPSILMWECISSEHGWKGNRISFKLDENEGKTRILFEHTGWEVQDDFYAACCFSWGKYLESLRQYCQTGTGEAFGSPGYRK